MTPPSRRSQPIRSQPIRSQPIRSQPIPLTSNHDVVGAVLARADWVAPADRAAWHRLVALLDERRGDRRSARLCAVLANLAAVVLLDDAGDHAVTARLATALGEGQLVRLQRRAAVLLAGEDGAGELMAAACRRWADPGLAKPGADAGWALVLDDVESAPPVTGVRSVAELLAVVSHGSFDDWRAHLGLVAASPWGPYAAEVVRLARRSRRSQVQHLVEDAVRRCRERRTAQERAVVAKAVKDCVARSGVSQRELAAHIGTSPSRLSSYVTGAAMPSATTLVRIHRASVVLRERTAGRVDRSAGA
ncbi:helix-turn-helix domain-containing protein [Nocardioides ginsengisoli]|uniref:Helix-turn-helix domain-containing protein n=1 Tax=Nocardioides ginsengisoli TaxID=363868 RepID=A0ABW3VYP5_9ACTN